MQIAWYSLLGLLMAGTGPAWAHADSPASPPLVPTPLQLKYQKPAEIIALFAREQLSPGGRSPRTARTDVEESLLPGGTDALLPGTQQDAVVLVGTEGVADVRDCIEVIDVPVESAGLGRERVVVKLQHADAVQVRAAVLGLPEAGKVVIQGRQIALTGTNAWLHRALRQVIRAELHEQANFAMGKR